MLKRLIPRSLKERHWKRLADRALMEDFGTSSLKHARELGYWRDVLGEGGSTVRNDHYEPLMLKMSGETGPGFVAGKIVADFGCGPRGSLCWATAAKARIGIDVLADEYVRFGTRLHDMTYVCSTETSIPLPSDYVDLMFTINALDHTDNLGAICSELVRTLTPGGLLVASFNLDEPATDTEPQTLTPEVLDRHLLKRLRVISQRIGPQGPYEDRYRFMLSDAPLESHSAGHRIMWVRAEKVR